MDSKNHIRSSEHGRKLPAHARPSKPPLLAKRTSYHHPHKHGIHHVSGSKAGPGWSKRVGSTEIVQADEEPEGMESFLQFCATCEKQIFTPSNSVLYCSEACKKKDKSKPTPLHSLPGYAQTPTLTPNISPMSSYFDFALHDVVPQRSPTVPRPLSGAFSDLSIAESEEEDEGTRDNDPTMTWYSHRQPDSSSSLASMSRRPRINRASTAIDSTGLPSLIHSPSSSYGTVASDTSYQRPLPPRHTRSATKSIDLVIPTLAFMPPESTLQSSSLKSQASTQTAFRVAESSDLSYGGQLSRRDSQIVPSPESVKQLFEHDAIRAPPKNDLS